MALTNAFRDYVATKVTAGTGTNFDNTNAYIGVGNGTTGFLASQTDLAGASKLRKGMDATYPQVAANVITFKSTFGTTDANFAWEEWGVFNAGPTGGVMMNRVVANNGTKAGTETKVVTVTITLSV
jgi:hypothetical protein